MPTTIRLQKHRLKIRQDPNKYAQYKLRACRYQTTLKGRYRSWKFNAKKGNRNYEFSVSLEYLESLPKICYYTGVELTLEAKKPNTISLDRIDNTKGYIEGNVVFCCADINHMKTDLTEERFYELCKAITNHKEEKSHAKSN